MKTAIPAIKPEVIKHVVITTTWSFSESDLKALIGAYLNISPYTFELRQVHGDNGEDRGVTVVHVQRDEHAPEVFALGLLETVDAPVFGRRLLHGLRDTLDVLEDTYGDSPGHALQPMQAALAEALAAPPQTLGAAAALLRSLLDHAHALAQAMAAAAGSDRAFWTDALMLAIGGYIMDRDARTASPRTTAGAREDA